MAREGQAFEAWLEKARLSAERLSAQQRAVLQAAFQFLEHGGHDYASRRFIEHFLLHAQLQLKVAQIARLVNHDRCTTSRHQACSSAAVANAIQNRLAGKYPGKLLPRYAGPIAQFCVEHPRATRDEILDFLDRTWQVRPGYSALDRFLRKYGLVVDHEPADRAVESPAGAEDPSDTAAPTAAEIPLDASSPDQDPIVSVAPASCSLIRPAADFFCPHPVRRRVPDAPRAAHVAAGGRGMLCR